MTERMREILYSCMRECFRECVLCYGHVLSRGGLREDLDLEKVRVGSLVVALLRMQRPTLPESILKSIPKKTNRINPHVNPKENQSAHQTRRPAAHQHKTSISTW